MLVNKASLFSVESSKKWRGRDGGGDGEGRGGGEMGEGWDE